MCRLCSLLKASFRKVRKLYTAGFYGLYGIFSRLIGSEFGNFSQNYIRNIFVFLIIFAIIVIRKTKVISIRKKDIGWVVLWFISGSWVTVLTFIGFNNLQIGTAYLVIYSAMIFSGFLSGKIFFKEKMNYIKLISLFLSIAGLFIIYRFNITQKEIFYVGLVFISGFMTGIWNTVSKKFSGSYSNNQLVAMDAISSVVAAGLGALIFKESPPLHAESIKWLWVFVYAAVQTINVGLVVYGFKNMEAQTGSIILPIEIIFATTFSYLIFNEVPSVTVFCWWVFDYLFGNSS